MQVHMQNAENLSPEQIREFLQSSAEIEFGGGGRSEVYAWTERVLVAQEFGCQGKKERGVIRAYMEKITGFSTSQMTRLIRIYLDTGSVREKPYRRRQEFPVRYRDAVVVDILARAGQQVAVVAQGVPGGDGAGERGGRAEQPGHHDHQGTEHGRRLGPHRRPQRPSTQGRQADRADREQAVDAPGPGVSFTLYRNALMMLFG